MQKKYSNKKFLSSPSLILKALKDWEKLEEKSFAKPIWFLEKLNDTDSSNTKRKAKADLLMSKIRKAYNEVMFFSISLSKMDIKMQKQILNDKSFAPYKYYLQKLFESGKYLLSESEEKIINLKNQITYDMWVDAQKALLNKQTVKFKKEDIAISKALALRHQLNQKDRHELHGKIIPVLKSISHMAEAEINAVYTDKKIDDELRGYKTPYEQTVIGYENDLQTVENLVSVINKNIKVAHKFFQIRSKVMGLKKLKVCDLYAPISKTSEKKLRTEDVLNKAISIFDKIDIKFGDYIRNYAKSGQIDFLPRKGKRGGAYCSSGHNLPTYVLLNVIGSVDDILTLSHEMGHAIHAEYSQSTQTVLYEGTSISVAEVASTFFEQLVIDDLIENSTSDEEKLKLFDEKMKGDIGTIFRQISYFNYELKLHNLIREKGGVSKEEMAKMFVDETKSFVGKTLDANDDDGYVFLTIPHFRYFFYVYSYALGQIISRSLCAKYKANNSFIEKVEEFLKSGQSASPRDIFLKTGIDIADPEFIQLGIDAISEDLIKYEKVANRVLKSR